MQNQKKILIVFPEENLAYSPTTLNIFRTLKDHFDTKIVCFVPYKRSRKKLEDTGIIYIDTPKIKRIFTKAFLLIFCLFHKELNLALLRKCGLSVFYRVFLIKQAINDLVHEYEIIAVDFMTAWVCQKIYHKSTHFVSLEIYEEDPFFKQIDGSKTLSVLIQNQERFDYLFEGKSFKTFFVQNAPKFHEIESRQQAYRKGLVFSGAAEEYFGFFKCLDFLILYPEYTMTHKGPMLDDVKQRINSNYKILLLEKRLVIEEGYIEQSELSFYLNQFRIGFCFYDLTFERINRFNYITAPSGKLFQYYLSGIPVVASSIPGLNSVSKFNCGVSISDLKPEAIYNAILEVEKDYELKVKNCFDAAKHYDFNNSFMPFVSFLKERKAEN